MHQHSRPPTWQAWVDGSYDHHQGQMGCAAVIRNPRGQIVAREIELIKGGSSTEAEARAVLLGLKILQLNADPGAGWKIFSDCQSIASLSNMPTLPESQLAHRDILEAVHAQKRHSVVEWVPRRKNRDADQCANLAHSLPAEGRSSVPEEHPSAEQADYHQSLNRWNKSRRRIKNFQLQQWSRYRKQFA